MRQPGFLARKQIRGERMPCSRCLVSHLPQMHCCELIIGRGITQGAAPSPCHHLREPHSIAGGVTANPQCHKTQSLFNTCNATSQ